MRNLHIGADIASNRNIMFLDAQNRKDNNIMHDFAKRQRMLEINPKSPLIEGVFPSFMCITGS